MQKRYFTAPDDVWHGGHYELAIELGQPSDERLFAALQALWEHSDLHGVFEESNVEPYLQQRRIPLITDIEHHRFGIAQLPNGAKIACGSNSVREDSGSDWFTLYIPLGALGTAYEVGSFPFYVVSRNDSLWRSELDSWLASIGQFIFERVPFNLALIGHEVSGTAYAENMTVSDIPAKRWIGYLWENDSRLQYFPCTECDAPWRLKG